MILEILIAGKSETYLLIKKSLKKNVNIHQRKANKKEDICKLHAQLTQGKHHFRLKLDTKPVKYLANFFY